MSADRASAAEACWWCHQPATRHMYGKPLCGSPDCALDVRDHFDGNDRDDRGSEGEPA